MNIKRMVLLCICVCLFSAGCKTGSKGVVSPHLVPESSLDAEVIAGPISLPVAPVKTVYKVTDYMGMKGMTAEDSYTLTYEPVFEEEKLVGALVDITDASIPTTGFYGDISVFFDVMYDSKNYIKANSVRYALDKDAASMDPVNRNRWAKHAANVILRYADLLIPKPTKKDFRTNDQFEIVPISIGYAALFPYNSRMPQLGSVIDLKYGTVAGTAEYNDRPVVEVTLSGTMDFELVEGSGQSQEVNGYALYDQETGMLAKLDVVCVKRSNLELVRASRDNPRSIKRVNQEPHHIVIEALPPVEPEEVAELEEVVVTEEVVKEEVLVETAAETEKEPVKK